MTSRSPVVSSQREATPASSTFSPLRHPSFRLLWIASLASNTGIWVQNTGAGWLMTSLAPSPIMVSLVQTASMLPIFLLALPAGAIADILDRRRHLIMAQGWMCIMGALLCLLTALHMIGPWGLLAITFSIGIGSAMNSPAWQATTPELVPRHDLTQAIVLNSIGFNIARSIGPALGGFIIGLAGTEAAFAFNAVCFLVLIMALIAWKPEAPRNTLPKEHFLSAMRAGMRFVGASPLMRTIILRSVVYVFFSAAVWGLLPLLVRYRLELGPEAYGLLLGAMGVGAVCGGLAMTRLRRRMGANGMVFMATLLSVAALLMLGLARHWALAGGGMLLYGASWIIATSTMQAQAQMIAPTWVRARAIGIYQLSFNGMLALGATLAGWLGDMVGVHWALLGSGIGGLVAGVAVRAVRLEGPMAREVPSATIPVPEAPAPELAGLLARDRGRVLEGVRYCIDPTNRAEFLAAMADLRRVRLRSGALWWKLYEDVAHPEFWVEFWSVESWTEHLREMSRLEPDDRAAIARATALHRGETPPQAFRYLAQDP
ncbi:MFS transporter [Roseomonas marmotae]|uniref:MFS transporter n=1 Tax=Roseomonas marmotae TaxID=2768161 RepID=A0ABS3KIL3_9PROT|nr:MFS transporter [Roseomonas marmotae]MBO1076458.1 MFS transporter [Roseomonas marmotae]QTI77940.1 MFS transporter [Roseomonas marmotae]